MGRSPAARGAHVGASGARPARFEPITNRLTAPTHPNPHHHESSHGSLDGDGCEPWAVSRETQAMRPERRAARRIGTVRGSRALGMRRFVMGGEPSTDGGRFTRSVGSPARRAHHRRLASRPSREYAACARRPDAASLRCPPPRLLHPLRMVRPMGRQHSRRTPWAYDPERIVGLWWCPVCGGAAHRYARPGRPRVYCSNACRQRAYRSRRDTRRQDRPSKEPMRRATSRERSHAVREPDAIVGGRRDTFARAVTLCGAFARPAHPRPRGHTRFVSDVPWSCRSCTLLGGLTPAPP